MNHHVNRCFHLKLLTWMICVMMQYNVLFINFETEKTFANLKNRQFVQSCAMSVCVCVCVCVQVIWFCTWMSWISSWSAALCWPSVNTCKRFLPRLTIEIRRGLWSSTILVDVNICANAEHTLRIIVFEKSGCIVTCITGTYYLYCYPVYLPVENES